ncbi:MAG: DUF2849 domain-containing protein [Alphaproteobacteria bacterium]|nr:DUF2849 domain-containing protein [Alphaproteobacteria bacterium]
MSRSRKAAETASTVVTANDLRSGAVVFRTPEGRWDGDVATASVAATTESAATLLAAALADAAAGVVVEPVLVAIESHADGMRLATLRERIRACGPSVGSSLAAPPRA